MHAVSVGLANRMHRGGEVALAPVCYPLGLGNAGLGVASVPGREPKQGTVIGCRVTRGCDPLCSRSAAGTRPLPRAKKEASEPVLLLAQGTGSN